MVAGKASLIYTAAASDPYRGVNSDSKAAIALNQKKLDELVGSSNYDLGHLFTTETAGRASVGSVCNPDYKGQGVTGIATPTGDPFDVDYVSHEIGHQFGANHTFNTISGACKDNRSKETAYEPGSGSTIMGYAGDGICDPSSLQKHSDAYFHNVSLVEIREYAGDATAGGGGSCGVFKPTSFPAPPVLSAGSYIVPKGTPFLLAADTSGMPPNTFVFNWEEFDLGDPAPPDDESGPHATPRPLFRSQLPSGGALRMFPDFSTIIHAPGAPSIGESLPLLDQTMKFRLTARNNRGTFAFAEVSVMVDANSGPFKILAQVGGNTWQRRSAHTLRWDVAGTDNPPVRCSRLVLQLTVDDDPAKLFTLATGIPNSGSYSLTVPPGTPVTDHAHLVLRSEDNIFLAVSP